MCGFAGLWHSIDTHARFLQPALLGLCAEEQPLDVVLADAHWKSAEWRSRAAFESMARGSAQARDRRAPMQLLASGRLRQVQRWNGKKSYKGQPHPLSETSGPHMQWRISTKDVLNEAVVHHTHWTDTLLWQICSWLPPRRC